MATRKFILYLLQLIPEPAQEAIRRLLKQFFDIIIDEIVQQAEEVVSQAVAEQLPKPSFTPDLLELGHDFLRHVNNAGLGFRIPRFPGSEGVSEMAPRKFRKIMYVVVAALALYFLGEGID